VSHSNRFDTVTNSGDSKTKEVIIGEGDPLWVSLRHKHMAEVITYVLSAYNDFLKENKATKLYSGKKVESLKEMADAMRSMPQYQEMLSKVILQFWFKK
jgi:syntaxin-binding protein 1